MSNPILLLGRHGAGKDTIATLLQNQFKGVENVKFGELNKRIAASACDIPWEYTNDRTFRRNYDVGSNFGIKSDFTLIDLLNVLYNGSLGSNSSARKLVKTGIEFTINNCKNCQRPVFTDVRRMQELNAVLNEYGDTIKAIYIRDRKQDHTPYSEGDEQLALVLNRTVRVLGDRFTQIDREIGDSVKYTYTQVLETVKWN